MKKKSTNELVLSSIFIAIGLILPMVFHAVGGAGAIFLPMHIPVIMAGFFLSTPYAFTVGLLTPLLSSFFTGMPPLFPVLPFMIVELTTYAVCTSLIYKKYNKNIYNSLIISMISGRFMAGIMVWILSTFFLAKLPTPAIFIKTAVVTGIPGIIIQLLFIPGIIIAIQKFRKADTLENLV